MSKYDIFISYRRDGGEQSAKTIYDKLKELGYRVFLDVETLRSGAFNTKLYSVIEECDDVLVILSPNALDRCADREDWVRLEIAHALRCHKNVIPILLRGFFFPDSLPEEIETLRHQNGISSSVEFFDAFIKKLTGFLKSKPAFSRRIFSSGSWEKGDHRRRGLRLARIRHLGRNPATVAESSRERGVSFHQGAGQRRGAAAVCLPDQCYGYGFDDGRRWIAPGLPARISYRIRKAIPMKTLRPIWKANESNSAIWQSNPCPCPRTCSATWRIPKSTQRMRKRCQISPLCCFRILILPFNSSKRS